MPSNCHMHGLVGNNNANHLKMVPQNSEAKSSKSIDRNYMSLKDVINNSNKDRDYLLSLQKQ